MINRLGNGLPRVYGEMTKSEYVYVRVFFLKNIKYRLIFNFISRLIFNNLEHVVQKINPKITRFIHMQDAKERDPLSSPSPSLRTPSKSIDQNQEPGKNFLFIT